MYGYIPYMDAMGNKLPQTPLSVRIFRCPYQLDSIQNTISLTILKGHRFRFLHRSVGHVEGLDSACAWETLEKMALCRSIQSRLVGG